MRTFSFKRHFKRTLFRSPDWTRAKLMVQLPIWHIRRIQKRVWSKLPFNRKAKNQNPIRQPADQTKSKFK